MASAISGQGVVESFRLLLERLYPALDREYQLADGEGIDAATFVRQLSMAEEGD
jgi:hypothetical protein